MASPDISRDELRRFLEGVRARIENRETPPHDYLASMRLLNEVIEALEALDSGEVRPVFAPAKTHSWGKRPFLGRKLRIAAVQHVAVLRELGWSAAESYETVAKGYLAEPERVRKWWKQLGKGGKSDEIVEARAVCRSLKKLGYPFSLANVLKQIEKDGKAFHQAMAKKKPGKK